MTEYTLEDDIESVQRTCFRLGFPEDIEASSAFARILDRLKIARLDECEACAKVCDEVEGIEQSLLNGDIAEYGKSGQSMEKIFAFRNAAFEIRKPSNDQVRGGPLLARPA